MHTHTILGSLLLLAASGAAQAQQLGAGFQVTSFSWVASGGTLQWLDGSAYQTLDVVSAEAGGLGGSDVAGSTGFALQDQAYSTATAHASASAGATAAGTLSGQAGALGGPIVEFSQPHVGSAMAQQSQEFMLTGAGSVTFTVHYLIDVAALGGDGLYNYAQSSLDFTAGNYANASGGSSFAQLLSFEHTGGAATRSGSFTLTVDLAGPDDVGFYNLRGNAYASAVSAVPEPGTWAMMLLGLAGVGAAARRKRAC